jgi:hypothetical protein
MLLLLQTNINLINKMSYPDAMIGNQMKNNNVNGQRTELRYTIIPNPGIKPITKL